VAKPVPAAAAGHGTRDCNLTIEHALHGVWPSSNAPDPGRPEMASFFTPFTSRMPIGRSDPFMELHREMNRMFDDVFRAVGGMPATAVMAAPRIDVHEAEGKYELTAELPGVTEKDIDLRIEDDVLTIRGEKRSERKDEQARLSERVYGSFQRSIQLPFLPDPSQVQANFENGVLTISLPKQGKQEKSHRIEVRGGQGGPALTDASSVQASGAEDVAQQAIPGADGSTTASDGAAQGGTQTSPM
jgi:HSP20 family protein